MAAGNGVGQGEQSRGVRVGGLGVAGSLELLRLDLGDVRADEGVGGQAVLAAVVLGGGDGQPLAGTGGQNPAAQRAGQREVALQECGAVGHDLGHVGRQAQGLLDGGQQFCGLAGCSGGVHGRERGHEDTLLLKF